MQITLVFVFKTLQILRVFVLKTLQITCALQCSQNHANYRTKFSTLQITLFSISPNTPHTPAFSNVQTLKSFFRLWCEISHSFLKAIFFIWNAVKFYVHFKCLLLSKVMSDNVHSNSTARFLDKSSRQKRLKTNFSQLQNFHPFQLKNSSQSSWSE